MARGADHRFDAAKVFAFLSILMLGTLLVLAPTRSVLASSTGWENYNGDGFTAYVEYLPIVPYEPAYLTAAEEFPLKFHVWQTNWWQWITSPVISYAHFVPSGFGISAYYRDDSCVPGKVYLREHAVYRPNYSPDIRFLKPSSSILRIDSYQAGASSLGYGWAFVVVDRNWLNGRYIRFRWSGYYSYYSAVTAAAYIYDGAYDRTSDADFPEGRGIAIKGSGRLQTLKEKVTSSYWGPETVDVRANVASGTQSMCTIFFVLYDAWLYQTAYLDIDWIEIGAEGTNGYGRFADEKFDAGVSQERTGTIRDYGYIASHSNYVGLKRWLPTSTEQNGWQISWSLSGGHGPLRLGASLSTATPWAIQYNENKYYATGPDGRSYLHVSDFDDNYTENGFWGDAWTEGGGSLGIPNDLTRVHQGHHVLMWLKVTVYWSAWNWPGTSRIEVFPGVPYTISRQCYFIIGDDNPTDFDCWLSVQTGDTTFTSP